MSLNWSPSGDANPSGERWWLQFNEQTLWEGTPDPTVIFAKQDRILVPFSLLWTGFALFWETGASVAGWFPGAIFGLVFVAVGLYMVIGRFFYKRWDRRRTQYVVTNRRALVLRSGGRSLQEAPIVFAPMQVELARDGRHGSVIWSLDQASGSSRFVNRGTVSSTWLIGTGWPGSGSSRTPAVAFVDVTDFERLIDVVNQVRAGAYPPTPFVQPSAAWLPPSPPPTETEWYPTENAIRGSGPQAATAVLLVGLAIVVFTAVFAVNRVDEYLDHPPRMSAPGSTVLKLAPGTYVIFEHPSSPRVPNSCPSSQCATFGPTDVAVVGTSGARPVISADLSADQLTEKGLTYRGIVEFDIGESGNYRIVVRASAPGQLLIDPSPGQEVHAFAGWIALGATGLMAIVIAVVLIVRARWRRRLPATWRIANS
jgi:hypothetical protein